MEPNQNLSLEKNLVDRENVGVIEWEDFENELTRFVSLSSALNDANEKKQSLQQKLEVLIRVRFKLLLRVLFSSCFNLLCRLYLVSLLCTLN